MKTFYLFIILFTAFLFTARQAGAQYKVQGTVMDSSRTYPLPAVSVLATNGKGTVTNTEGFYQLEVSERDSIWFSYLGKPTVKFPVLKMADIQQFDIALQISIPVLPEVRIRPRNYRQDSLQNREDYAKIFNFRKPSLGTMTSIGPGGAGIDINELIRSFQFRKNRSTLKFQERLLQQEQDKFIDHRFNKGLVRQLTGLEGAELDKFMALFRPDFEFTALAKDYDFHLYIKESFQKFRSAKTF